MKTVLSLENCSIGYEKPIVSGINATLIEGEIAVLMGKNGAGKSTLLQSILKQLSIHNGSIYIQNKLLQQTSHEELSREIAVVFSQNKLYHSMTVEEVVSLGRFPYKKWYEKLNSNDLYTIHSALEITNLLDSKHKNVQKLSDGNVQKVFIARAIAQQTPIIVLDEPLSHLDIENQFIILSIFKKLATQHQKSILFTSHDWENATTIADKLWYIKSDSFHSGNVEDVALERNLLHIDEKSDFSFNYCLHKYMQKPVNEENKSIYVLPNGREEEAYFWVQKALLKNGFDIQIHAETRIEIVEKNTYKIYHNHSVENVDSIEKIIRYLT